MLRCAVLRCAEEVDKIPDDMESLVASFDRLEVSLQQAQDYVAAVVAGKRKGSVAVGRYLAETIASVPHFGKEEFERPMEASALLTLLAGHCFVGLGGRAGLWRRCCYGGLALPAGVQGGVTHNLVICSRGMAALGCCAGVCHPPCKTVMGKLT